jgi:hypothetical protein
MPEEIDRQSIIDEEHLKLLSLSYMISAGVTLLFSIFGVVYIILGIAISISLAHAPAAAGKAGQPPPAFVGWIFAGIGIVIFLVTIVVAIAKYWAGRCIKLRKSRTYCMVIAALGCIEIPYGTVLGVLTFIVLGRESVVKQFARTRGREDIGHNSLINS